MNVVFIENIPFRKELCKALTPAPTRWSSISTAVQRASQCKGQNVTSIAIQLAHPVICCKWAVFSFCFNIINLKSTYVVLMG